MVLGEAKGGRVSNFETSLVYIAGSRTAKTVSLCSLENKIKNQKSKKLTYVLIALTENNYPYYVSLITMFILLQWSYWLRS